MRTQIIDRKFIMNILRLSKREKKAAGAIIYIKSFLYTYLKRERESTIILL